MSTSTIDNFLGQRTERLSAASIGGGSAASTEVTCSTCGASFPNHVEEFAHNCERLGRFQTIPNGFGGTTTVRSTDTRARAFQRGSDAAQTASGERPATKGQITFLTDLVADLYPDGSKDALRDARIAEGFEACKKAIAKLDADRKALRAQKAAPAPVQAPAAPAGFRPRPNKYAAKCDDCGGEVGEGEGILTKSDDGKWIVEHKAGECRITGFPFPYGRYALDFLGTVKFYVASEDGLFAQASDDLHPIRSGAQEIIDLIAADPKAAAILYGRELGRCGRCNRTLTDEASRAAGIGPVCAGKAWA